MRRIYTALLGAMFLNTSAQETGKSAYIIQKGAEVNLETASPERGVRAPRVMPPQGPEITATKKSTYVVPKAAELDFTKETRDLSPTLVMREMPKQSAEKIEQYSYPNQPKLLQSKPTVPIATPVKSISIQGNKFFQATPCDNDMAISDSGMVISVMNTNIFFYNAKTNVASLPKSLSVFTNPINNDHSEFDPKVVYDPKTDRFILVCLIGGVDSVATKTIIGFSKTNDPKGQWNLYALPGNPFNNGVWSDYPMIALTEQEMFLSLNLIKGNAWQTGFIETIVWQIRKDSGYAGKPLNSLLHSNIKYNGKPIRNLCPVKGGSKLYGPDMFFVSNRNFASQNDTVFLVRITDLLTSPNNSITVQALTSNQYYYFPSNARQPVSSVSLATNDARNLGAFIENGVIQYVQNTNHPNNNRPTIGYGVINSPYSSPSISAYYLPNDSADYGYPNISYAGTHAGDNSAIITFDHSSNTRYPGVSAIQTDGNGSFSTILAIQSGSTFVNFYSQNQVQRWGDYTGSQRKYNRPGEVWMSGYYAYNESSTVKYIHGAWIAQLLTDSLVSVGTTAVNSPQPDVAVFPVPTSEYFSVEFSLAGPEKLTFRLYDVTGKLVETLLEDWVSASPNQFSFRTNDLTPGVYFLKIKGNSHTNITRKIVIDKH